MPENSYTPEFYDKMHRAALDSAREIVPLVIELVRPESVLDVGCGVGTWLSVFLQSGVSRVTGVDGKFVDDTKLAIPRDRFKRIDLSRPFRLDQPVDLTMCLEVAEHLPERMARPLIKELTSQSSVVLFSAAVPGQGGNRHINEQWHGYWHKEFKRCDFETFDVLRPTILWNNRIAWWYRQNLFVYARRSSPLAAKLRNEMEPRQFEILAPHVASQFMTLRGLGKALPGAFLRALRHQLRSMY